jgi:ribose-phosphate pyrophosphokinase
MIKINEQIVEQNHFPDGTTLMKQKTSFDMYHRGAKIEWLFENNEELVTLIYLTQHLRANGVQNIYLYLPYIPNARQDRVKDVEDIFTLKYFADIINYLNFNGVQVLDAHSYVSIALIDRVAPCVPKNYIDMAISNCNPDMLFYPDEGSVKRYSSMAEKEYAFGIKRRDWATGKIEGLDVAGCTDKINGSRILIVDDICSRGGTFVHSARKLKELGAKEIYLYITHCENTILEGELLTSGLIEKVYTTNSIFTKEHEKIEVFEL